MRILDLLAYMSYYVYYFIFVVAISANGRLLLDIMYIFL